MNSPSASSWLSTPSGYVLPSIGMPKRRSLLTGGGLDAKTAARLRELEAQKAAAVAVEDYDEAKRLKLAIDGLRQLSSQLAELEARQETCA